MCEHLIRVEDYLKARGAVESWRGQPWTDNCREWVYFEAILNPSEIRHRLHLDACVEVHDYYDIKAGSELGLVCTRCQDGVMGMHPESSSAAGKPIIG